MSGLRILVADDHEIVRHGIRALVTAHPGWEVCAEATNGREAVDKTAETKPDIVILDIGMPSLNGLNATRQILQANPQTKVLILTMYESDQVVREVLAAGARGYLLKSDAGRDLSTAIEALQRNKTFFTSRVADMVLETFRKGESKPEGALKDVLTAREREVVQLLAEGKSTKEVAVLLGLSVKTAETHRSNIMRKLNIHSVSELVLYAVRNNIVQVPQSLTSTPLSSE
jgi:DNA-binding NarL/FixJ family response regulator